MTEHASAVIAMIEQISFALIVLLLIVVCWDDFRIGLENIRLPRAFATAVIVGTAGFMVFGIYDLGWDLILMAVTIALAAALSLLSLRFGLCFFVSTLLLRPWEVIPDSALFLVLPRGLALLLLSTALFRITARPNWKLRFTIEDIACFVFVILSYASTFMNPMVLEAQQVWMDSYSRALMLYILIRLIARGRQDVRALSMTLGIVGISLVAITLYRLYTDPSLHVYGARAELFGMIGDPNDLAATLLLAVPLFVAECARYMTRRIPKLLVIAALAALSTWVIIQTQSRGAFVGLLVAGAAFALLRIKNLRRSFFLIPLGLVLAGALLFATLSRSSSDLSESSTSRMAYWKAGWNMAVRNPIVGVGFNAYPLRFEEYVDSSKVESKLRTAHSMWVLGLAETGFVGLACLIVLFLGSFGRVFRIRQHEPGLFVAFAGYFAAASFLSHTYLLHPYILAGIGVSAALAVTKTDEKSVLA